MIRNSQASPDNPFYIKGKGYVEAGKLHKGDSTSQGGVTLFRSISYYDRGSDGTLIHEYIHFKQLLRLGYGGYFSGPILQSVNGNNKYEVQASKIGTLLHKYYTRKLK